MKRVKVIFVLAAFQVLLLFNCGGNSLRSIEQYDVAYIVEATTMNYFLIPEVTGQRVAANTQDQLVENDRFGRYVPALAESWVVSPDNLTWTFRLRPGQFWVDSTGAKTDYEITADDFVEGFRYVADPANGIRNLWAVCTVIAGLDDYYYSLVDSAAGLITDRSREQLLGSFDGSVGVRAADRYTVVYSLKQATPFFLSYLTMELFFPVEKAFLDRMGQDFGTAADRLLYSGGYYLSTWQRDKEIILTRNDHYWDRQHITARTVQLQKVTDAAAELAMFMRGELSSATLSAEQVQAITDTSNREKAVLTDLSSVTSWWHPNYASANPEFAAFIRNQNFRKALFYGIDHEALLSLDDPVNPAGLVRSTIIPEGYCFDEQGRDYTDYPGVREWRQAGNPYDPELARQYFAKAVVELLDETGHIRGVTPGVVDLRPVAEFAADGRLPLQLVYVHSAESRSTAAARRFQAMMLEVFGADNIEIVLGQFVADDYSEAILPNRYDLLYSSFRFAYADPLAQFGRIVELGGRLNVAVDSAAARQSAGFSDPELRELINRAAAETVLSSRYELFAQAENLMLDRAYLIPFRAGGGAYSLSKVVPYTMPRGGLGLARFKLKGLRLEREPLDVGRVTELQAAFEREMAAAVAGDR
ncbi:MAG: hypothetical protein A2087_05375 [Spirochaetes bacterium GWD1_61_31]|nr:MAG: hypothetical protein A2Y37_10560 [Spirochaetes bacterium GWB1_60_80]OHD29765.1 MAG: hypothetical protein A2004_04835 [Spirochaetes bacterium GWC1_61_12]OHD42894.1 MAG: hypothetical protein A2Y35_13960 [Spirochaetes bacterium GWE1_60_18]OHD43471.1 MAG: hypothetical protein A2087_05375 [Spirochaetes bacterium GWD1_61_31]OHD59568.1 MAG: hypothetical protein A2Y32_12595 [Spirochaetes bacterium GWF1_60_12]HAP43759.1 hypothetical protein [Spirochaetaceae bacterium]